MKNGREDASYCRVKSQNDCKGNTIVALHLIVWLINSSENMFSYILLNTNWWFENWRQSDKRNAGFDCSCLSTMVHQASGCHLGSAVFLQEKQILWEKQNRFLGFIFSHLLLRGNSEIHNYTGTISSKKGKKRWKCSLKVS